MASRNYTPEAANGNRAGVRADRPATEQEPNRADYRAHPSIGLAPFLAPKRDSPAQRLVKPPSRGLAGSGLGVAAAPDRPNAVGVAVGHAGPRALDTTAQPDQTPPPPPALPAVGGRDSRDALRRRARAKGLTQALADGLAGLGDRTPLRHSYLATLACAGTLTQDGGAVAGKYCGNRWCVVCSRIRTAKLQVSYNPVLATWGDAWFVTLTLPNVTGQALHGEVRRLLKALTAVKRAVKRTDALPFKAVRKLEVTYSPRRRDYHPHLHLVIAGEAVARAVVARWLAMHPDASPDAQDVRPATGTAELFKYVTKLCVKLDGKHTTPPPLVLDTIFKALRGLRSVQAMGFKVAANADAVTDDDGTLTLDASTPAPVAVDGPTQWEWLGGSVQDWVNLQTGEVLADHTPSSAHLRLLANVRAAAAMGSPADDGGGG